MVSLRARQSLPQQSTPKANKFEPDIDASPVSTDAEGGIDSDDDSLSEFEATPRNRFRPTAGPTLEEKLAQSSKSTGSPSKGKRKWSDEKDFKSPSSSRKRNSKELLSDSADFGGDIFSGIRSSQQSYKRRSLGYGSKFRKTPSSSMGESNPPSSSAPAPKSSTTEVSVKDDSPETEETGKEEDEDEGFKFPKDFDAAMSYSTAEIPDSEEEDSSDLSEWTQNSHGSFDKKSTINDSGDEDEVVQQTEFLCPLCSAPVDSDLLVLFQAQPKQRLREQRAFCESHKKASAEKEYRNKGYPIIDWDKLDKRIEAHINVLEKLLVLDPPSYYRNVLDTTLKQGKAKNFRLTLAGDSLETISCGYYGTRGSNKM
ncbi:hypothetical protein BJY04DRAFT_189372 [Aspergillus karnatakaensis]|uniref:RTC4 family protein n=1 Tax=Aspergillus karnatakaensis TaxID=1810916 RepID=UPI003CCD2F9E